MINNFKIALRSLKRAKIYTAVNIFGLGIGLACLTLIAAWVFNEYSYDYHFTRHQDICRVITKVISNTEEYVQAVTAPPVAHALQSEFPEIEKVVRLEKNDCIVRYDQNQFEEDNVIFADVDFFKIFNYQEDEMFDAALKEPYSIVLTESIARKYFAGENPVGKIMTLYLYDPDGNGAPYRVTAVVPDPPRNAHFTYTIIGSFSTYELIATNLQEHWFDNDYYTYILFKEGIDLKAFQEKLAGFSNRHYNKSTTNEKIHYRLALQPLDEIHLHSHLRSEIGPNGDVNNIYIFLTIGFFILLIACINYINLTTAYTFNRTKEIGIKKALGAGKYQVMRQFFFESLLTSLFSCALGFLFASILKPFFPRLTGNQISSLWSVELLMLMAGVAIFAGFLSGLYPAFFISGFSTGNIFKGDFKSSKAGVLMRKSLVVIQFAIAIVLIVAVMVIKSQMDFIQNKNLGFDKESLLALRVNGQTMVQSDFASYKAELLSNPAIEGVSISRGLIGNGLDRRTFQTVDKAGEALSTSVYLHRADANFLDVYGIRCIAGRNFSIADSQNTYLVNESALRAFGWGEARQALGKPVINSEGIEGLVIGVVSDFHFDGLKHAVAPLLISKTPSDIFSNISLRFHSRDLTQTIAFVRQSWRNHFPDALFEYTLLDQKLALQYEQEQLFGNLLTFFVVVALIIASLGLFGLSAWVAKQRTKEIGIRKVLGAGVSHIINLLSGEFVKLVLIANIIAWPVAWLIMANWLEDFAYRIDMSWWMFMLSAGIALLIALTTVSLHAFKTALSNPAESLRYE